MKMKIHEDWLHHPTTPDEVEEELAQAGAPDLWLQQWRAFLDHFTPGDELWEYFVDFIEIDDDYWSNFDSGFALVRDGAVVDSIVAPDTLY